MHKERMREQGLFGLEKTQRHLTSVYKNLMKEYKKGATRLF